MGLNSVGGLLSIPLTFVFAQIIRSKGVKWPTVIFVVLYGVGMMLAATGNLVPLPVSHQQHYKARSRFR